MVNPDKGYIVSCNNFNGSERSKYGVSHAFAFVHRRVRISEMIESLINSGKKLTVKDMQDITFDVLDVQMRESYADIIATAEKGLQRTKLGDKLASKARLALKILADWDYKYEADKPQGAVMEAWEYAMGTYMHETKISDVRVRRTVRTYAASEHFVYKQIAKWAKEQETYAEYCYVYDLNADNSCQEMVAYTFAKAIEDIEARLGPYTGSNWRMGDLVKSRYEH